MSRRPSETGPAGTCRSPRRGRAQPRMMLRNTVRRTAYRPVAARPTCETTAPATGDRRYCPGRRRAPPSSATTAAPSGASSGTAPRFRLTAHTTATIRKTPASLGPATRAPVVMVRGDTSESQDLTTGPLARPALVPRAAPRSQSAAQNSPKCVRRLNSAKRFLTSPSLRRSSRFRLKSSTENEAMVLPAMMARVSVSSEIVGQAAR